MGNNSVVMITGASKGLGKELALEFARNGARLAICARQLPALQQVEQEIKELGGEVVAVEGDVSNPDDVNRFVSVVEEVFSGVDVLINNASIFGPGPSLLADYPNEAFNEVLHVNVLNPFLMTKRVLPGMLSKKAGSIINLTSEAGKTGFAEWGAYGISKFAVEGLTQTWAEELEGTGVRINMVDPGEMDTDMHKKAVPDCDYPLAHPSANMDIFNYLASTESIKENGRRFEAQKFQWKQEEHHA
ncbi:SDR family NAD(P)-dependent oxidoreductase [Jeotgalibacillus proteolyticus]|uniref:3-oxoacyl-ACP reductase n=1 Tax=Jeotgalibacillus proteolyticus TaxID=2082395 RepID=A0A2S5GCP3_9BACL|nr:SDR family oxidoreductase [Jeotgalibacillus proteolyticus]PPA70807.1 3-oxoacyl-ACP reductase [Jeotgalibacillus proteolyticus]